MKVGIVGAGMTVPWFLEAAAGIPAMEVTALFARNEEKRKELCEKYAPASVNAAISSLNSFFCFIEWHDIRIKALKIQRQIFSSKYK